MNGRIASPLKMSAVAMAAPRQICSRDRDIKRASL